MKKLTLIYCLTAFSISLIAQPLPDNQWIKYDNANITQQILSECTSLNDSIFLPDLFSGGVNNSYSIYWNGKEWVTDSGNNSLQNILMAVRTKAAGTIYLQAPLSQGNNSYTVFTKEGWVQVNSALPYIPHTDKILFDKNENRLILLKGNDPWIYNIGK